MPILNTVYRKGNVCLPQTLTLPDDHPVAVFYDEPAAKVELPKPAISEEIPRHPAPVYPEEYPDFGEDTYEYVAPPKPTRTVMVTFVDGGVHQAPQVADEE